LLTSSVALEQHFFLVDHKDSFCYTIGIVINKGHKMQFETRVIELITPVLKEGRDEFFECYLFLEGVKESTARQVFSVLCREFDFKVQPSKFADYFVYDFVA
jgi:hypothetical protein